MPSPAERSAIAGRLSVFISYRRDDTAGFAGRLYDELTDWFGPGQIFMDVDTIRPGEDFAAKVEEAVARCDVLLVLIGPSWLTVADAKGGRRLDRADDMVRLEVEAGLRAGKQIIPILLQGAVMPKADDLPESLRPIAFRQALEISHTRWRTDVSELRVVLEKDAVALHPGSARGSRTATVALGRSMVHSRTGRGALAVVAVALAIVVAGALGVSWLGGPSASPGASSTAGPAAGATGSMPPDSAAAAGPPTGTATSPIAAPESPAVTSGSEPPASGASLGPSASGGLQSVTLALSTALFPDILKPALDLAVSDRAADLAAAGYAVAISGQSLGAIGGSPDEAGVTAARSLVADASVIAVIGPETDDAVTAELPITNAAGLLQCAPSAMDPRLTKATFGAETLRSANPTSPNLVSLLATWDEVGAAAAGYASMVLGAKKALVIDDSTRSSQIFADSFATAFGPSAATRKTVTGSVSDFSPMLGGAHDDVVVFAATQPAQAAQLKLDMAKAIPGAPLIVGDDELSQDPTQPGYLDAAGAAAKGTYLYSAVPATLPGLDDFTRQLATVDPQLPAPRAIEALYVACTQVIMDVLLEHPHSTDIRGDIRAQVYCGCSFDSIAGPVAFTPEGDNTKPSVSIYQAAPATNGAEGDWNLINQIQVEP